MVVACKDADVQWITDEDTLFSVLMIIPICFTAVVFFPLMRLTRCVVLLRGPLLSSVASRLFTFGT